MNLIVREGTADVVGHSEELVPPGVPPGTRAGGESARPDEAAADHRVASPTEPLGAKLAFGALLAATAALYLIGLSRSGWANAFYSAAVQAGTKSWKAFFFGSFDASSFITVDKPPASLWVMELSARLFGLSSWSILVPQALEGVAAVALLCRTVRRRFGWQAGLIAGATLAITPVAALMFRFDNPDALLALLMVAATWATLRATERGETRFLVLAATLVGVGFLTKTLQAWIVVPVLFGVYLLCAPVAFWRRVRQLAAATLALLVSSLWWVVVVELVPARDRPYIGGSQDNSEWNLIFGYNGFGRLSGNESGSVTGAVGHGASTASVWGPTGWNRLFLSSMGGQISWLLPAALLLAVAALWWRRREARSSPERAAYLVWGGSLLLTAIVFSYAKGIIHPYYTVALAPPIAALVGMGSVELWRRRHEAAARAVASVAVAGTALWAFVLLDRSSDWMPWLRVVVLVGGLVAAGLLALGPKVLGHAGIVLGLSALGIGLAAPFAYSIDTAASPHTGSLPSAGPAVSGAAPGGIGAPGAVGAAPGGAGPRRSGGSLPSGPPTGSGFPGGAASSGAVPGAFPAGAGTAGARPSGGPTGRGARSGALPGGAAADHNGPGGSGSAGGLLQASTPGKAVRSLLEHDAGRYRWVAATVGAQSAAGYQLGTGDPVMAIGGFNGTDPAPSLKEFISYVRHHDIHYFIGGGSLGGGPGTSASTSSDSQAIASWVEKHFSARTVDGLTIYDLTRPR